MRMLARWATFAVAICGLVFTNVPASAAAADISGTWEVTIHYPPPEDAPHTATYILKQAGETITGTYHGPFGPADVAGTIKANDVTFSVTVQSLTTVTARFSGTVSSATRMSGTVTGTHSSDQPMKWSAEKK